MDTTPASDIASFLDRYAEALAAGDLPGIAACYALPALVVGDASTIPVTEAAQVEAAFAGAADAYRGSGPGRDPAELRAVDPLTPTLTLVDVGWSYLDEAGAARQRTSYRYLLRRSDADRLGIQVVVDTTPQP
jgi:hypothetical protein